MAQTTTNQKSLQPQAQSSEGRTPAGRGAYQSAEYFLTPGDLFRLNPFTLMRRMIDVLDRTPNGGFNSSETAAVWVPAIEVARRNGDCVIRAELPGMRPEEVRIEATDDGLVLEGERKFEHEENREGLYRSERQYGRFFRTIPLPKGAQVDEAKARFENGVLEITVPIAEQKEIRRQIPVETGQSDSSSNATGSADADASKQDQ